MVHPTRPLTGGGSFRSRILPRRTTLALGGGFGSGNPRRSHPTGSVDPLAFSSGSGVAASTFCSFGASVHETSGNGRTGGGGRAFDLATLGSVMDSWGPLIISGTAFTKTAGVSTSSIHGVSSVATSCGVSLPWSTGLSESLFAFCEAGDFEVTVLQALFERAALTSPIK